MAQITADMTIEEALQVDKDVAPLLMGAGMPCLGCLMASGETVLQAASVHGVDGELLLQQINDYLASKAQQ